MAQQWFHQWFGSPYYHILYQNRNHAEAEHFINQLYHYLKPAKHAKVLEVGCGRGRHAVCLNKKGLEVTGIDLAIENIHHALLHLKSGLQFFVHDMRALQYQQHFDLVTNLFTSFGYFTTEAEHVSVLKGMHRSLKPGGILVMDYFNTPKILPHIIAAETKTLQDINFQITKKVKGKDIIKTIDFEAGRQQQHFEEIVKAFTLDDFKALFTQSGFELTATFGSYYLDAYDAAISDRLIMICKTHA